MKKLLQELWLKVSRKAKELWQRVESYFKKTWWTWYVFGIILLAMVGVTSSAGCADYAVVGNEHAYWLPAVLNALAYGTFIYHNVKKNKRKWDLEEQARRAEQKAKSRAAGGEKK